jgi:hypothetical protein
MALTPELTAVIITGTIGASTTITAAIMKWRAPMPGSKNNEVCPAHSGLMQKIDTVCATVKDMNEKLDELRLIVLKFQTRKDLEDELGATHRRASETA